jgi:site-specific recombinase
MADHGNMDIKQHKGTYEDMMAMFKWACGGVAIVAIIVVLLISS